jgi:N-acetylmuramoyl-L-alanine amidase
MEGLAGRQRALLLGFLLLACSPAPCALAKAQTHHQGRHATATVHHPHGHGPADRAQRYRNVAHPSHKVAARAARSAEKRHALAASLPLIVLDPGHGGRDSGAVGVHGVLEKTITFETAVELRHLLLATGHYRVQLTRSDDHFVSLAARTALAASPDTALFVSIHANASPDRAAHGASVYVRSGIDPFEPVSALPADTRTSAAIGHAMSGLAARPGSALLQYTMVDQLSDDVTMVPDPARQGHLYVLSHKGTPSVLLELGFLTNRHEEKELTQPRRRAVIALAIRDAIDDYFTDLSQAAGTHI